MNESYVARTGPIKPISDSFFLMWGAQRLRAAPTHIAIACLSFSRPGRGGQLGGPRGGWWACAFSAAAARERRAQRAPTLE